MINRGRACDADPGSADACGASAHLIAAWLFHGGLTTRIFLGMVAMTTPSLDEVIQAYSQPTDGAIASAEAQLIQRYWLKDLVPLLVEAYPHMTRRSGRIAILVRVLRFTRERVDVVPLAIGALSDRAHLVRELACSILAYSLRVDVIPHLQAIVTHADERTRADALAAIDAISHQNQHYFVDRKHTGQTRWIVKPSDLRKDRAS